MAALTLDVSESFSVGDVVKKGPKATISSLTISTDELTPALFEQALSAGSPPGYTPFTPFIVGDHQYQDAIVKGILTSDSASSPRLKTLELDIDVPDIFDRGSVTTSSSALVHVSFARSFNSPPEVLGTLKSGTVIGSPNFTNITTTGFDVELLNVSNARIVGLIGWHAKGY